MYGRGVPQARDGEVLWDIRSVSKSCCNFLLPYLARYLHKLMQLFGHELVVVQAALFCSHLLDLGSRHRVLNIDGDDHVEEAERHEQHCDAIDQAVSPAISLRHEQEDRLAILAAAILAYHAPENREEGPRQRLESRGGSLCGRPSVPAEPPRGADGGEVGDVLQRRHGQLLLFKLHLLQLTQGLAHQECNSIERQGDQYNGPQQGLDPAHCAIDHHHQLAKCLQSADADDARQPCEPNHPQQGKVRLSGSADHGQGHLEDGQHRQGRLEYIPQTLRAAPELLSADQVDLHHAFQREEQRKDSIHEDPTTPLLRDVRANPNYRQI
mmetsp:Transcript_146646/g.365689  ORF Transcript_146646/g.365689 Transcript_146646/m.365689 type:complete len:325 (+) Transcript_146646:596-1570(+)